MGSSSLYVSESVIDSAVGILLVKTPSTANAMTVSFFSEVAHHPTGLWVAVAPTTYSHSLIQDTCRFSLAVLNQHQQSIALACGSVSGRDRDKCSDLDLYESRGGFLFLNHALASTGCTLRATRAIGDHTLFIADIAEAEIDLGSSQTRHLLLSDL